MFAICGGLTWIWHKPFFRMQKSSLISIISYARLHGRLKMCENGSKKVCPSHFVNITNAVTSLFCRGISHYPPKTSRPVFNAFVQQMKLRLAHSMKEWFYDICHMRSYRKQQLEFDDWITNARDSRFLSLRSVRRPVKTGEKKSSNAFKYGITNSPTEGFNNKNQSIKEKFLWNPKFQPIPNQDSSLYIIR